MAEEARRKVLKAWGKILPFGAQVVASAAAYTVGVTATQVRPAAQRAQQRQQRRCVTAARGLHGACSAAAAWAQADAGPLAPSKIPACTCAAIHVAAASHSSAAGC